MKEGKNIIFVSTHTCTLPNPSLLLDIQKGTVFPWARQLRSGTVTYTHVRLCNGVFSYFLLIVV